MKLSKPLSALILIALALLLSAAGENPETPKPQPNQNAYAQSPAQQHSPPSSAPVSATFQATSTPSTSHRETDTYYYYYPAEDGWNWSAILQAAATLGLLAFALWQMDFVRRSTTATENAAKAASDNAKAAKDAVIATEQYVKLTKDMVEAAKQSADAAQLAATAERPYLLIEKANLDGVVSRSERQTRTGIEGALLSNLMTMYANPERLNDGSRFFPNARFTFKNYGKGPALIDDLLVTISVVEALPSPRDFTGCQRIAVHPEAVGTGEPLNVKEIFSVGLLGDVEEKVNAIQRGSKTLIVYGRLKYRDVSKNPHETGFCWIFTPPKPLAIDVLTARPDPAGQLVAPILPHQFTRGPDSHNYSD